MDAYSWDHMVPASETKEVYFILDDRIVGVGAIVGGEGLSGRLEIIPSDLAAMQFFEDDHAIKVLGRHGGLWYSRFDGKPMKRFSDESESRHKGTFVVSKFMFDQGHSPMSCQNIRPISDTAFDGYVQRRVQIRINDAVEFIRSIR